MLYTRKGDDGTTKLFGCDQRMSKSSAIAEALGSVDELNALLGFVKMRSADIVAVDGVTFAAIIGDVQQDLFVVQAELAGADKKMDETRIKKVEALIGDIEKELPPITSFFVSGGTELGALCDYARTVTRRAERSIVAALEIADPEHLPNEEGNPPIFQYMNRLSSLLYALARLANHRAGIVEEKPHY